MKTTPDSNARPLPMRCLRSRQIPQRFLFDTCLNIFRWNFRLDLQEAVVIHRSPFPFKQIDIVAVAGAIVVWSQMFAKFQRLRKTESSTRSPENRETEVVLHVYIAVGGYFAQPVGGEAVGERQGESEGQFYPDVGEFDIHFSRQKLVCWENASGVGGVGDETLWNGFKSDGVLDDRLRRK